MTSERRLKASMGGRGISWSRRLVSSVAIAVLMALGIAAPSSAHHNTITGSVSCKDSGGWLATWLVVNSESDKTETIMESNRPNVVPVGTTLTAGGSKTFTEYFSAKPTADVTLTLKGKWSNGVTQVNSGSIAKYKFTDDCASKQVEAKALCDHEIVSTEWHFVITQVQNEASAPSSIKVTWDNGQTADVPLDKFTGGVAHYTTTLNLGANVTSATMSIYGSWSGQFNLSHGPACKKVTPPPVPEKEDQCNPPGVTSNIRWKVVPPSTDDYTVTGTATSDLTITLKDQKAQWSDGTTAPKVYQLGKDSGEACPMAMPTATITVDCNGFVVNLDNTKGTAEATYTVTKPDGTTEIVKVPAGQKTSRTYPVVEDKTASVTVKSEGMKDVTASYTADCVKTPPPPVPPVPPTPPTPDACPYIPGNQPVGTDCSPEPVNVVKVRSTLGSNCLTARLGEFSAYAKNYGISTSPVWVKVFVNGHLDARKKLRPGKSYGTTAIVNVGSKVRLVVKTRSGMLDVKRTTVPDGCGGTTHDGGLRTQQSAAG